MLASARRVGPSFIPSRWLITRAHAQVWAWVIGSLCGILATLNPHATAFRNTMDSLNSFMALHRVPSAHRTRLREFFRHARSYARAHSYDELYEFMSHQLRGDTALHVGRQTLSRVWYFDLSLVENEFIAVVALNLSHHIYEAREKITADSLAVVMKGLCAHGSEPLMTASHS